MGSTDDNMDDFRCPDGIPSWELMQAFVFLSRHKRYESAAASAGVNISTLRRRIQKLEKLLGRKLFVNENGLWTISPELDGMLAAALEMEAAAFRFGTGTSEVGGRIRISVLESLAMKFAPAFSKMQEMHPNLQFSISTETKFVDLRKENVDVAIRLARPTRNGEGLRIRKIGILTANVYASKQYRETVAANGTTSHKILDINTSFFHQDHDFALSGFDWDLMGVDGDVVLTSDSFAVLAKMCSLGQGVAILPDAIVADYPELERVNGSSLSMPFEAWMVSRLDLTTSWQKTLASLLRDEISGWR